MLDQAAREAVEAYRAATAGSRCAATSSRRHELDAGPITVRPARSGRRRLRHQRGRRADGLHPQTLRTYERLGLITPGRTGGGGRRYSHRDIELLREIAELTSAGIGIEGVRRILELEHRVAALRSATPSSRPSSRRPGRRCVRRSPLDVPRAAPTSFRCCASLPRTGSPARPSWSGAAAAEEPQSGTPGPRRRREAPAGRGLDVS